MAATLKQSSCSIIYICNMYVYIYIYYIYIYLGTFFDDVVVML